jgi:hypothetical protein
VDAHLPRQVQLSGGSGRLGLIEVVSISTVPRPVLLAVVGAVAVLGLFFVSRRGEDTSVPPTPAPSQTSQPGVPAQENVPQGKTAPAPDKGVQGGRGLPSPVARALDAKKTVVITFWNPRAVDDRSVKKSVDRLSKRNGKVAKFTDTMQNLSRYTRVTAAANVTTSPAVVIVNSRGQAEVLNGYYDFQTLNQYVSNAVRRK